MAEKKPEKRANERIERAIAEIDFLQEMVSRSTVPNPYVAKFAAAQLRIAHEALESLRREYILDVIQHHGVK